MSPAASAAMRTTTDPMTVMMMMTEVDSCGSSSGCTCSSTSVSAKCTQLTGGRYL